VFSRLGCHLALFAHGRDSSSSTRHHHVFFLMTGWANWGARMLRFGRALFLVERDHGVRCGRRDALRPTLPEGSERRHSARGAGSLLGDPVRSGDREGAPRLERARASRWLGGQSFDRRARRLRTCGLARSGAGSGLARNLSGRRAIGAASADRPITREERSRMTATEGLVYLSKRRCHAFHPDRHEPGRKPLSRWPQA